MMAYENYQTKKLANNLHMRLTQEIKQRAASILPELIATADQLPKDYWYSDERPFYIEPFYFERITGRSADGWQNLLTRNVPNSSFYFRYQMQLNQPISVEEISDGKVITRWFWKTSSTQILEIEQNCAGDIPFIENCGLLEMDNGHSRCFSVFGIAYEQNRYQTNEEGIIFSSHISRLAPFSGETFFDMEISYEYKNGKLAKIYRNQTEWDNDPSSCILFPLT